MNLNPLKLPALRPTIVATFVTLIWLCCSSFGQLSWHRLRPVSEVCFVNGNFFLLGAPLTVTPDGSRILDLDVYVWALAYGSGKYVGASGGGRVTISTNAHTWKSFETTNLFFARLAFGNENFVAVVDQGLASSPDGEAWTLSRPLTNLPASVIFAGGRFIAVGQGIILVSDDGRNWAASEIPAGYNLKTVAWGNGTYVAAGDYVILTSSDGHEWTVRAEEQGENYFSVSCITFDGTSFLACGYNSKGYVIYHSTDGNDWSDSTAAPFPITFVAHGNGSYLAVGRSLARSKDGRVWEEYYRFGGSFDYVCHGPDGWVASDGAGLLYSPNGLHWAPALSNSSYIRVIYALGRYIAAGEFGFLLSTNGRAWKGGTSVPHGLPSAMAAGNEILAVVYPDYGSVLSTRDLTNWSKSPPGKFFTGMTFAQGQFVAVNKVTVAFSRNAVDWELTTVTNFLTPVDLCGSDAGFVAVGTGGRLGAEPRVAFSRDGRSWNVVAAPKPLLSVTYGDGMWVAGGSTPGFALSVDGTNWLWQADTSVPIGVALAFGDGVFIGGGTHIPGSRPTPPTVLRSPRIELVKNIGELQLVIPPFPVSTQLYSSSNLFDWTLQADYREGTLGEFLSIPADSALRLFRLKFAYP